MLGFRVYTFSFEVGVASYSRGKDHREHTLPRKRIAIFGIGVLNNLQLFLHMLVGWELRI